MDSVTHFHAKNRAYIFLKVKALDIFKKKKGGGGKGVHTFLKGVLHP